MVSFPLSLIATIFMRYFHLYLMSVWRTIPWGSEVSVAFFRQAVIGERPEANKRAKM